MYVVEWAAVPEAESYEVNVMRTDMNGGISSETTSTSKQVLPFLISSTDININFSIRASNNCLGYGEAYMLNVDLSLLKNLSISIIHVLGSVTAILGGILAILVVFILVKTHGKKKR